MLKKNILILCVVSVLIGCKTLNIHQLSQTNTTQQVSLGSIGLDKDFLLQQEFNNTAIPSYKEPLKIAINIMPFNKQTYKAYRKAKASQSSNVTINYIDSIPNKPKYVKLQIADKVAVIKALNSKENNAEKEYLINNTYANVLTNISIALSKNDLEAITKADAVFLIEKTPKSYVLQLHKNSEKTQIILFNQGVVFAYKASNCCWQENKKYQLSIVDLVSEFNSCPNKTYRSATRAKKKINYFKL